MRRGLALTFLVLLAAPLCAQNISSGVSGTVVDGTGAVIAGAEIRVMKTESELARATRSNETGYFSIPDLLPGEYTLSVDQAGFKRLTQRSLRLNSGEQRSLGRLVLQVGETSETVTVEASAAAVQLGSSEKAGSITQEMLSVLAFRGRDVMDAVGLLPGVVDTSESRDAPANDSTNGIHIGGGRSNSKNVTIDGVTNLDTGSNGSVHALPSMDSIGEVKVLQSNYAAEYGRNSGGAITIITRGGGKQFRGSAGWYHRHENYSANNFFNNQRGVQRPPYRYNIGSYTFGGPIYLPGRFNRDRSRLFFFWSQEFQRQLVEFGTRTVTVPTLAERQGDYSNTRDTNGRLQTIQDPLNVTETGTKLPFPNGRIPTDRFHPIGQKILNLFPAPNFVDPNPSRRYNWNYLSIESGSAPRNTEILRIDYSPHQKVQSYLRMVHNQDEQQRPYGLWVNGSVNYPLVPVVFRQPGRGATLQATTTFSPSFFSETIFGVSQNKLFYYPRDPEKVQRDTTGVNVPQWNPDVNPSNYIPNMTFGGVPNYANPSMSNGMPYYNANTIFSLVQNFSKIHRTHTFKFGLYFERTRKDQMANATTRGQLSFDRNGINPYDTNWAYSNALIGSFNSYSEASGRPQGQYRFSNIEYYFQDAWRVRPRLLLDYGIRFYSDLPQYDARNQLATFVPDLWDPSNAPVLLRPISVGGRRQAVDPQTGKLYNEGYIGTFVPGVGDPVNGMRVGGQNGVPRGLYSIRPVLAAPRVGFAWDPFGRGRTAVRGGAGVFYDRIQGNPTMNTIANPPTILTPIIYNGTLDTLAQTGGQRILAPTASIQALTGRQPLPTVYNFSFGVQQQFGKSYFLDVSYVGSLVRHGLWQRNINPVPLYAKVLTMNPQNRDPSRTGNNALPDNFLRPMQGMGDVFLYEFSATSNYNSLQVRLDSRRWHGLMYGVSYTFSKTLGTADTDTSRVSPFFAPRSRNYGRLAYDRPQVFSFWYNYQVPNARRRLSSRLLGQMSSGWQFAGTARYQDGGLFNPSFSTLVFRETVGTPSEGARIDIVDPRAPLESRFQAPAAGGIGNAGHNILRHPGFFNLDASVFRDFRFEKRYVLQLRFETYNSLNHTQISALSTAARFDEVNAQIDPLFLQPNAARSPRRVQLALRFNF